MREVLLFRAHKDTWYLMGYTGDMEAFLQQVLGFLLKLLTLFVSFFISILNLILDFARTLVGSAS